MSKLFLDDVRPAPEGWELVKSYGEFVDWVTANGVPDVVSFDHDLAPEHYDPNWDDPDRKINYPAMKEPTGYDCAKYLVKVGFPKLVRVHSWNVAGAANIANLFRGKCDVFVKPYNPNDFRTAPPAAPETDDSNGLDAARKD
jgi:hypothetical protein